MAKNVEQKDVQDTKQKKDTFKERYGGLSGSGKIVARIIDAQSGLRILSGVYAIRMMDEGVRRLFMNDYTPTLGSVIGDVTLLSDKGEEVFQNIKGFYKLQHNVFTLLVEERFVKEK